MSISNVRVEIDHHIATITLARAEALNAFDMAMYADLARVLSELRQDPSVTAAVIQAEGQDFSAGNDIGSFVVDKIDPEVLADREQTPSTDLVHQLIEFDKPLIACVQGRAIGFGATLLLHCDIIVGDPSTHLIYPFVKIGIVPEAGATRLLAERVGALNARRLLLLGGDVKAEDAVQLGLITEIAATPDAANTRSMDIAAAMAGLSTDALSTTKRLLNRGPEPIAARVTAEFLELGRRLCAPETQTIMQKMMRR